MKYINIITFSLASLYLCSCQSTEQPNGSSISTYDDNVLSERAPEPTALLHRPFDFPLILSGNFGELRANHFHSGIDFKTQGEIKKPIHCAEDGYVSQISVSGGGYGRAIYVTHPSIGLTTVYAHIHQYAPKIDSIVRAEQYRRETFAINIKFPADSISVSKGEIIALSGNSGHSFGPHLHMEVRHTATGDAIDPLPYFKSMITDSVPPKAHKLILYPDKKAGLVNGSTNATYLNINNSEKLEFNAWGLVYPAINANDYMTNTHNAYGVKYLTLKVDGQEVYKRTIDRFQFNATRAINTLVNYKDLIDNSQWHMHTRIPQSRPLGCMIESALTDGAINIDSERDYNCEFIMSDEYDNKNSVLFTIHGAKSAIKQPLPKGKLISYFSNNDTINHKGINIRFFKGCLYEDINVDVSSNNNTKYHSPIYTIGNNEIPIDRSYRIAIDLNNDNIINKKQYCIVRINGNNKSAYKSLYKNGKIIAYVNRFGDYAITTDESAPKIFPRNENKWTSTGIISYYISDNLSGIKNYRGEIDGKWVMFELDSKNALISYHLDPKAIKQDKSHIITIKATDNCGNEQQITNKFYW